MLQKLIFTLLLLVAPMAVFAADPTQNEPPKLQITIPGFEGFSRITKDAANAGSYLIPFLGEYIGALYRYSVFAGSLIAAFLITVGGFQWAVAGGDASRVKQAKARVTNAVTGLLLLIMSYVFLFAINPDFVKLKSLRVLGPAPTGGETEIVEEDTSPTTPTNPATSIHDAFWTDKSPVCYRKSSAAEPTCEKWCADNPDQDTWPTANPDSIDPDMLVALDNIPNVNGGRGRLGTQALHDHLVTAIAKVKSNLGSAYSLKLVGGYRSLHRQIEYVCQNPEGGNGVVLMEQGLIAQPGKSNHGQGTAIDLVLQKDGSDLMCSGAGKCKEGNPLYAKDPAEKLLNAMTDAGFLRLRSEIWHFEYGTSGSGLCGAGDCPLPSA